MFFLEAPEFTISFKPTFSPRNLEESEVKEKQITLHFDYERDINQFYFRVLKERQSRAAVSNGSLLSDFSQFELRIKWK